MRRITIAITVALALPLTAQHLTADEAVRISMENNYGVRIARSAAEQAKVANNPGAAGMLPRVDARGAYSVDNAGTKQEFFTGEKREADNANTKLINGDVELNWTLFDGLSMFAAKDRLDVLERLGETQLRQELEVTIYDVLTTYYQLVQLEKAVLVQREGMQTSRERMTITETGERIGSSSGLELVQARLDLSADSAQMLDLLQQTAITRNSLNTLLARDPGTTFAVDTVIPATGAMDLAALRQAALSTNTSLQQAREQRMVSDLSVKELRGTLLPQVEGFANYGYSKQTSEVGFLKSSYRLGPQYGLMLSIPLFRGGAIKAVKQAQLAGEQADLSVQQTQLELERDLLNTWSQYENAKQRVD
ncbi:MAG: TolC family protein, partial [Flavobacteriales bacterium]